MSTFRTSRGTRGQHVSPRDQSSPYHMHPGRREHIHGRIQFEQVRRPIPWSFVAVAFVLAAFGASFISWAGQ